MITHNMLLWIFSKNLTMWNALQHMTWCCEYFGKIRPCENGIRLDNSIEAWQCHMASWSFISIGSDLMSYWTVSQYHGCWCPGDVRSQGISIHDIDLCLVSHYLNQCWFIINNTLRNTFQWILLAIQIFSLWKRHLKLQFPKWQPFCSGLNVLIDLISVLLLEGSWGGASQYKDAILPV